MALAVSALVVRADQRPTVYQGCCRRPTMHQGCCRRPTLHQGCCNCRGLCCASGLLQRAPLCFRAVAEGSTGLPFESCSCPKRVQLLPGRRPAEQIVTQHHLCVCAQAERDAKRYSAFEKKATLTAQAERLKTSMKESQLTHFRTETKSR